MADAELAVRSNGGLGSPATTPAARILAASRFALLHAATMHRDAELWISVCDDDALALGAFQRAAGVGPAAARVAGIPARRGSGGPAVVLGPGTVHVALVLARADALTECDAPRLLNRYVRPLLRGLTRAGFLAHYFGRDWVSVAHRPAAWVGFAHDATTGCAMVEAFVATRVAFAPDADAATFRAKAPATLEEIAARPVTPSSIVSAVADAYAKAYGRALVDVGSLPERGDDDARDVAPRDPQWHATVEDGVGTLGAGPDADGVFRVGGDLMASRDAVLALERALAAAPDAGDDDVARLVDAAFDAPGVTALGMERRALVDVITRARAAAP